MGWWENTKDFFRGVVTGGGELARDLGRATGVRELEDWGDAVVQRFSKKIAETIKEPVESIRKAPRYDPQDDDVKSVVDYTVILTGFKKRVVEDISPISGKVSTMIRAYARDQKAKVRELMKAYQEDLDFSEVDRALAKIESDLIEVAPNIIHRGISLSDSKCEQILSMSSSERASEFQIMAKKYINECLDGIGTILIEGRTEIDGEMMRVIDSQMEQIKNHVERTSKDLEAVVAAKQSDQATRETAKAMTIFTLDCCKVTEQMIVAASTATNIAGDARA